MRRAKDIDNWRRKLVSENQTLREEAAGLRKLTIELEARIETLQAALDLANQELLARRNPPIQTVSTTGKIPTVECDANNVTMIGDQNTQP